MLMNRIDLGQRFNHLSGILKSELTSQGFWTGELSPSALATAVSIVALQLGDPEQSRERIDCGANWLIDIINKDGGFGDTPGSLSNVSATLLVYSALNFCAAGKPGIPTILKQIEHYLDTQGIAVHSTAIVSSILDYYGKDYTFSLPILSMLVICRVLRTEALEQIPRLPFELTLLPARLYRFFNLQVVSYAIPALVAVGIYLFKHKRGSGPVTSFIRTRAIAPALRKLLLMMPESGGFLEAIPLTAFVSMCLIQSGFPDHTVVVKGLGFLKNLQRSGGSWPIDTNLSTWVTTLAIKAYGRRIHEVLDKEQKDKLRSYLIGNQYKLPHPFNHARPGGWGWTSFSGSVPDADDTAGAILGLMELDPDDEQVKIAILRGCYWLAYLQNHDGGLPTFCKGWGRLPFDRSCADLTGHALLAWILVAEKYKGQLQPSILRKLNRHACRAIRFLEKEQRSDGSWLPLWFGNQSTIDKSNPVYGTGRVMTYLRDATNCKTLGNELRKRIERLLIAAGQYILHQQNEDGSWGGQKGIDGTIEETALAICSLLHDNNSMDNRGFEWLEHEFTNHGLTPHPIGLYFATLWYYEKIYPLVFYLEALRRAT